MSRGRAEVLYLNLKASAAFSRPQRPKHREPRSGLVADLGEVRSASFAPVCLPVSRFRSNPDSRHLGDRRFSSV
jgi:hypothetical protein